MMEALSSSETSGRTRATRRNIQEDGILHRYHLENLKFMTQFVNVTFVNVKWNSNQAKVKFPV
jgi:hypothetical protein